MSDHEKNRIQLTSSAFPQADFRIPNWVVRSLCLVLSLVMTVGDPSWASGVSDFLHTNFSSSLTDLSIPLRLGTITDRWTEPTSGRGGGPEKHLSDFSPTHPLPGSPTPFVILIQDLHANVGVQKNIDGIIEHIYNRYGLSGIYSEAAFGVCDPSVLRTLPSRRAQNRLIDKLLAHALVSGDDIAAARIGHGSLSPVRLVGVDDPMLYLANVQAFRDLATVGLKAAPEWKSLRDLLMPGAEPRLRRHLELTENLLELKLTDSDWLEYKEHREFTPQGSPTLNAALAAGERFYTAAEARNGAFTENLLIQLAMRGTSDGRADPAILVTGGFHTATVAHNLKIHGIGFVVVTPTVARLDQEDLYRLTMTVPPQETVRHLDGLLFNNNRSIIAAASALHMNIQSWIQGWSVVVPRSARREMTDGRPTLRQAPLLLIFSWFQYMQVAFMALFAARHSETSAVSSETPTATPIVVVPQISKKDPVRTLAIQIVDSLSPDEAQSLSADLKVARPVRRKVNGLIDQAVRRGLVLSKRQRDAVHALVADLAVRKPIYEKYIHPIQETTPTHAVKSELPSRSPPPSYRIFNRLTQKIVLGIGLLLQIGTPSPAFEREIPMNRSVDSIPGTVFQPQTNVGRPIRVQSNVAPSVISNDAKQNVIKAKADLKSLQDSIKRHSSDTITTQRAIEKLEAQIAVLQTTYKTTIPQTELDAALTSWDAVDLPGFNHWIAQTRNALVLKLGEKGAIIPTLDALKDFADSIQTNLAVVKKTQVESRVRNFEPGEAENMAQSLIAISQEGSKANIVLEAVNSDVIPALHLFGLPTPSSARRAALLKLPAALKATIQLGDAIKNQDNPNVQAQNAIDSAARVQAEAEQTQALFQQSSYRTFSLKERQAMAERLAEAVSDRPLSALHATVAAMAGSIDSSSSWEQAFLQSAEALQSFTDAQASLANDSVTPESLVESLGKASRALTALQKARQVFHQTNPLYDAKSLPTSVDQLPVDTKTQFQLFKTQFLKNHPGWETAVVATDPLLEDDATDSTQVDRILLTYFYSDTIDEIGRVSVVRAGEAIQDIITLSRNRLNPDISKEESLAAGDQKEAQQDLLKTQLVEIQKQTAALPKAELELKTRIALSEKKASGLTLKDTVDLSVAEIQPYKKSIKAVEAQIKGSDASAQELRGILEDLHGAVNPGRLDEGKTAVLFNALSNVLNRLPDIVNQATFHQGKPNLLDKVFTREPPPNKDVMNDLHTFFLTTALLSARELAGIPQNVLDAALSDDASDIDALKSDIPIIAMAPGQTVSTRQYADYLQRTSKVSWFDVVRVSELYFGIKNFNTYRHQVINDGVGANLRIAGATPVEYALGIIEGGIALKGVMGSANSAIFGKQTADAIRLAPKIFKGLSWSPVEHPDSIMESNGRSVRLFHQLPATPAITSDSRTISLWEATNTRLQPADVIQSKNWKLQTEREQSDHFFVVVDGKNYSWVGNKETASERATNVENAVPAAARAYQILPGLGKGLASYFSNGSSVFSRSVAGLNAAGVPAVLGDLIESGRNRYLAYHEGGFISTPGAPDVVLRMAIPSKSGNSFQTYVWTATGQTYNVAERDGYEYWEDKNGMPIWKIKGGQAAWLNTNLLYMNPVGKHGYIRRRDQIFEASLKDVKDSLALLISEDGKLSRRRAQSAPVYFVQGTNQAPDALQTTIQNETVTYELTREVLPVPIDGKIVQARAYYKAAGDHKDYIGVIAVDPKGSPVFTNSNIVSVATIYAYQYSQPQQFKDFLARATEGQWGSVADQVFVLNDLKPFLSLKTWSLGEDGHEHLAQDGKDAFVRWHDDIGQTYLFDQRVLGEEKLYRLDGKNRLSLAVSGLRAQQKVAKLKSTDGVWSMEPSQVSAEPWNAFGATLLKGGKTAPFAIWTDGTGVTHARVPAGLKVPGVPYSFTAAGDWRLEAGLSTLQKIQSELADAPFVSRIPSALNLKNFYDENIDPAPVVNGSETFYNLAHPAASREGAISIVVGADSKTSLLQVSPKGLAYLSDPSIIQKSTLWSPIGFLPSEFSNNAGIWDAGQVPPEILKRLPTSDQSTAEATYSFNPDSDYDFYLRVRAGGHEYFFHSEKTAVGEKASAGQSLLPLATFIPRSLVLRHPDYMPGVFQQSKNDEYLLSKTQDTRAASERYIKNLLEGGRYSDVLPFDVTLDEFARYFIAHGHPMKDAWGRDVVSGWSHLSGKNNSIKYGGMKFLPYSNPLDPQKNYVILEAAEAGLFTDPGAPKGTHPVSVRAGQIVFVSNGGVAYVQERAELIRGKDNKAAAVPYLIPIFRTPAMLMHDGALSVVPSAPGSLSAYLGAGAQSIKGQWYSLRQNGGSDITWVFQARKGGSYTDAITGKPVVIEEGSTYILQNSVQMAKKFLQANLGTKPSWISVGLPISVVSAGYAQTAASHGFKAALLQKSHVYRLPGTSIVGSMYFSNVDDPDGPVYFAADVDTDDANFGHVKKGDVFVQQLPPAYLRKILDAKKGAQALLFGLDGSVTGVAASSINDPAFSGLQTAGSVSAAKLVALSNPVGDAAIVQFDSQGKLKGQFVALQPLNEFIAHYAAGYGTLRVRQGVVQTSINGHSISLAGIVGISEHSIANHSASPTEVDKEWVFKHIERDRDAQGKPKGGWILRVNGHIVDVVFGVKAAQYASTHNGIDPKLNKGGIEAAVYGFDGKNTYLTKDALQALGSNVVSILEVSPKEWLPAFWDKQNQVWYLLERSSKDPSVLVPQANPFTKQPIDENGHVKGPDAMSHGLLQVAADPLHPKEQVATIVAFVEFKAKPKVISTPEPLSVEELANAPFSERWKDVKRDARNVPLITLKPSDATMQIVFVNKVNHHATLETSRGNRIVSTAFFFDSEMKRLNSTLYFGARGIEEPLFRMIPATKAGPARIDEVYRTTFETDAHGRRLVESVQVSGAGNVPFTVDPSRTPEEQYAELWSRASAGSERSGPAVHIRDYLKEVTVSSGEKVWLRQFRNYMGLSGVLWQTQFRYDSDGRQIGSKTRIGVSESEKKALQDFLKSPESENQYASGPNIAAWNEATIDAAVPLSSLRNATGGPLLPLEGSEISPFLHDNGLNERTWVLKSHIVTSWGTTQFEVRPAGDAQHVLFEQGVERRLNIEFSGDNPIHTYLLNDQNTVIGESLFDRYEPWKNIFTEHRLNRIADRAGITLDELKRNLLLMGVNGDVRLPAIKFRLKLITGHAGDRVQYGSWGPYTELYLLPEDPPRGREIGRYVPQPSVGFLDRMSRFFVLDSGDQQGDFVLNLWWQESKVATDHSVPFGDLPENITLRHDGSYLRARFASTQILHLKNRDGSWIRGLDGKEISDVLKKQDGMEVNVYQVESTNYNEQQLAMLFTKDGTLAAEDYRYEIVRSANGFGGLAALTSTLGVERVYYDNTVTYRRPLLSVLTRRPLIDYYLNPAFFSGTSEERRSAHDQFRQFESVRTNLNVEDRVLKQFTNVEFKEAGLLQKVIVTAKEVEPSAPNKVWKQVYTYFNDTFDFKTRPDLVREWFSASRRQVYKFVDILGGYLALSVITGFISQITGRRKRHQADQKNLQSVPTATGPIPNSPPAYLLTQNLDDLIDQSGKSYEFAPDDLKLAQDNLRAALRNRNVEDYFSDAFSYYEEAWIGQVYQNDKNFGRSWIGEGRGSMQDMVDNLILWHLIEVKASNFRYQVMAYRSFMFKEMVDREMNRRDKSPNATTAVEDRDWLKGQISYMYKIMLANLKSRGEKSQEEFLIYEDVQDLFRSKPFIDAFRVNKEILSTERLSEFKTFRELSKPSPVSYKGHLSQLYNFSWLFYTGFILLISLILVFAAHLSVLSVPFIIGEIVTIISLAGVHGLLYRRQRVSNEASKASVPTTPTMSLQNAPETTRAARRQLGFGLLFVLPTVALKIWWNALVFHYMSIVSVQIIHTHGMFPGAPFLALAVAWIPILYFFYLDTFAFFYVVQALFGYVQGMRDGLGRIRNWSNVRSEFTEAEKRFYIKGLPKDKPYSDAERHAAWARTWNTVIDKLREDNLISDEEKVHYQYGIRSQDGNRNFLNVVVTEPSGDFTQPPKIKLAEERLAFYLNSLFMKMPAMPQWSDRSSRSVMTPVYNEAVLYSMDELNAVMTTGKTFLTHLRAQNPEDWKNFEEQLGKSHKGDPDLAAIHNLKPGEKLELKNETIKSAVRKWVSYRFQALARTVRGIGNQREALKLQARIEFPDLDEREIETMVNDKFQYVVSYQSFRDDSSNNEQLRNRQKDVEVLLAENSWLQMVYMAQEEGKWYSVLVQNPDGNGIQILYKNELAGSPVQGMGEGKPENQTNMMLYTKGRRIETIDMNQDFDFEEALKLGNLGGEFNDTTVKLVGFPERISTQDYSLEGRIAAFADTVFVSRIQPFLALFGARYHYGHPDEWDAAWAKNRTGVSSKSYVNEDIIAGYETQRQGGRIEYVGYLRAVKAREVAIETTSGLFIKFGGGASQQAVGRHMGQMNSVRYFKQPVGNLSWPERVLLGMIRSFIHYFGSIGYFLREPHVKMAIAAYIVSILFLGISGFSAFPSAFYVGFFGILMSQTITFSGIAHLMIEHGWIKGLAKFGRLIVTGVVPFFQFQSLNFSSGTQNGLRGKAKYVSTGRLAALAHISVFGSESLYATFVATHLHWSFGLLALTVLSLKLWQNASLILSALVISQVLSQFYAAFLFNRGSTPRDVGIAKWWQLHKADWHQYLFVSGLKMTWDQYLSASGLKRLIGAGRRRVLLKTLKSQGLQIDNPLIIPEGFAIMSGLLLWGLLIAPFSVGRNEGPLARAQAFGLGVVGVVGILLIPFIILPWISLSAVVVAAVVIPSALSVTAYYYPPHPRPDNVDQKISDVDLHQHRATYWRAYNLKPVVNKLLQLPQFVELLKQTRSAIAIEEFQLKNLNASKKADKLRIDELKQKIDELKLNFSKGVFDGSSEIQRKLNGGFKDIEAMILPQDRNDTKQMIKAIDLFLIEATSQYSQEPELRVSALVPVDAVKLNTSNMNLWFRDIQVVRALRKIADSRSAARNAGVPFGSGLIYDTLINENLLHLPQTFWKDWSIVNSDNQSLAENRLFDILWPRLVESERREIYDGPEALALSMIRVHRPEAARLSAGDQTAMAPLWESLNEDEQELFADIGGRKDKGLEAMRLAVIQLWLKYGGFEPRGIDNRLPKKFELRRQTEVRRVGIQDFSNSQILQHRLIVGAGIAGILIAVRGVIHHGVLHVGLIPFVGIHWSNAALNFFFWLMTLVYTVAVVYEQDRKNRMLGGATENAQVLHAPQLGLLYGGLFGVLRAAAESFSHGSFASMVLGHSTVDAFAGFGIGLALQFLVIMPINFVLFKIPDFPILVGGLFNYIKWPQSLWSARERQADMVAHLEGRIEAARASRNALQEEGRYEAPSGDYGQVNPTEDALKLEKKLSALYQDWVTAQHWRAAVTRLVSRSFVWLGFKPPVQRDTDTILMDDVGSLDQTREGMEVESLRLYTARFQILSGQTNLATELQYVQGELFHNAALSREQMADRRERILYFWQYRDVLGLSAESMFINIVWNRRQELGLSEDQPMFSAYRDGKNSTYFSMVGLGAIVYAHTFVSALAVVDVISFLAFALYGLRSYDRRHNRWLPRFTAAA